MDISSNRRTVLLTLGRLPVALELARALHQSRWRVVVAEPFRWHVCRLSNAVDKSCKVTPPTVDEQAYLSEIEAIVQRERVSLIIPVSEETLFVSALHSRLPSGVELLCPSQSTLLQLHDKFQFAHLAQHHALPVPKTLLATDANSLPEITSASYIVKPRLSCSGVGVRVASAGSELHEDEIDDQHIVQQKLSGAACSSFSMVANGLVLTTVCYRSLMESGSVSVCFEPITAPDGIAEFIRSIVDLTHYSGMVSFDFIQDAQGVWRAIECNPRATSGLHFMTPEDIVTALVDKQRVALQPQPNARQEFWSCLMQVEGALFKGKIDKLGWRRLFTTKDITWRWNDMKPFLLMSFVLAPQLLKAIRSGRPVTETLMSDVGWYDATR